MEELLAYIDPFTIFCFLLLYFLSRSISKPRDFPPGPPNIPLIGGLFSIVKHSSRFHAFKALVEEHGNICGLFLGSRKVVIIADYKVLKDILESSDAIHRPFNVPLNETRPGWESSGMDNFGRLPGVLWGGGKQWQTLRDILERNNGHLGIDIKHVEEIFKDGMKELIHEMRCLSNKEPLYIYGLVKMSISNIMWEMLVGERLNFKDEKSKKVGALTEYLIESYSDFSPLLASLPFTGMARWPFIGKVTGFHTTEMVAKVARNFVLAHWNEKKQTRMELLPKSLMDVIISESKNASDEASPFFGDKGSDAIVNLVIDLMTFGVEAISSTITWMVLYSLHHPEVQERIHREIDEVVGKSRPVRVDDKTQLPYLGAVLSETLRSSCVVFSSVPHHTTKEVKVENYVIPRGTVLYGSLFHIMNDPEAFPDPKLFRPERFIDEDNSKVEEAPQICPFGIGVRSCPLKEISEKLLFFTAATIYQQFVFECDKPEGQGQLLPSYKIESSFPKWNFRTPPTFQARLQSRLDLI